MANPAIQAWRRSSCWWCCAAATAGEALADAHLRVNNGSALELDTDDATAVADLTALADVRLALDVAHVLSESEQQAMRDAFISRQNNDCDIQNVGGCDAEG